MRLRLGVERSGVHQLHRLPVPPEAMGDNLHMEDEAEKNLSVHDETIFGEDSQETAQILGVRLPHAPLVERLQSLPPPISVYAVDQRVDWIAVQSPQASRPYDPLVDTISARKFTGSRTLRGLPTGRFGFCGALGSTSFLPLPLGRPGVLFAGGGSGGCCAAEAFS